MESYSIDIKVKNILKSLPIWLGNSVGETAVMIEQSETQAYEPEQLHDKVFISNEENMGKMIYNTQFFQSKDCILSSLLSVLKWNAFS